MTKKLLSGLSALAFGLSCFGIAKVSAQSPAFGGFGAKNEEPLQMVIDYGAGKQNQRESHHGVVEPVGLPVGQQVAITLRFLRKRAGDQVMIGLLDGGQINVAGPVTIAPDGTVAFSFQTDGAPGLYRLMISGAQSYQLMLYAFDPNRPRPSPGANPSRP
ncbi:MAG: hypothetical protein V7609_2624 [Verrucomicrobiota bacterium]